MVPENSFPNSSIHVVLHQCHHAALCLQNDCINYWYPPPWDTGWRWKWDRWIHVFSCRFCWWGAALLQCALCASQHSRSLQRFSTQTTAWKVTSYLLIYTQYIQYVRIISNYLHCVLQLFSEELLDAVVHFMQSGHLVLLLHSGSGPCDGETALVKYTERTSISDLSWIISFTRRRLWNSYRSLQAQNITVIWSEIKCVWADFLALMSGTRQTSPVVSYNSMYFVRAAARCANVSWWYAVILSEIYLLMWYLNCAVNTNINVCISILSSTAFTCREMRNCVGKHAVCSFYNKSPLGRKQLQSTSMSPYHILSEVKFIYIFHCISVESLRADGKQRLTRRGQEERQRGHRPEML